MNSSKEKRARRIASLLAGYLRDNLTTAEHDELDEWVGASDHNLHLFEELTDEKRLKLALELLNDDTEDDFLKELSDNGIQAQYDLNYRRPWYLRILAAVVFVFKKRTNKLRKASVLQGNCGLCTGVNIIRVAKRSCIKTVNCESAIDIVTTNMK